MLYDAIHLRVRYNFLIGGGGYLYNISVNHIPLQKFSVPATSLELQYMRDSFILSPWFA